MVKINNQAVIQKLIDELRLYPSTDAIPTELAEKILPVFQINSQDVNVKIEQNLIDYPELTTGDSDKTYTVPDGKVWTIKRLAFDFTSSADVSNRFHRILIKNQAGELMYRLDSQVAVTASKATKWVGIELNMNASNDGVFKGGQNDLLYNFYLPRDLVLGEGATIQIIVYSGLEALDDMLTYLQVDEQEA